jgi:hypothetical protein
MSRIVVRVLRLGFQQQRSPTIDAAEQINTSFTWEDFQSYWKKVKEQTSSSLSALHFGHYKVVINDAKLCEMHAVFVDIAHQSDGRKVLQLCLRRNRGLSWLTSSGLFSLWKLISTLPTKPILVTA